jgi:N-acetylmuramoyl-L-alanine amidase
MRRERTDSIFRTTRLLLLAAGVCLLAAPRVEADPQTSRKSAARAQYERAEKLRTALQGKPQKERMVREYQALVSAFRRVYLITPHAPEATPALLAVAETYQEMGRLFDPKYYQSAIDAYQFLLHEYPTSRYRDDALFTIAQIQHVDLNRPEQAELSFQEFLKRFPRSSKAEQARQALAEIAAAREEQRRRSEKELAREQEKQRRIPQVTALRHWNAENYTRIVVDVEEEVRFEAARISNPDRIYFDISKAKLSSTLAGKTFEVQSGFLKTIRVAQNQAGVVRVVLEVEKVRDYSVFLLPNPYRLVVDIHGEPVQVAKTAEKPAAGKTDPPKPIAEKAEKQPAKSEKTERASVAPPEKKEPAPKERASAPAKEPDFARTTRNGQHSLTRALGLKIGRIVIDPGHGGHDTGTIGPSGLMEKDLCLDIAQRLGRKIQEELPGTEIFYTREDDTFIPLENRTALANQWKADLFISIHANSSRDRSARGVETYYLNFATTDDAMEVAARENALSQSGIHELRDLVRKIANNEKIEESRELAAEIQEALHRRLSRYSRHIKDRGVKRAPFVVLIGANMPSVLVEVSFLSNPMDESALKKAEHRQRVVEGLYRGVTGYLQNLNSLTYNAPRAGEANR